MRISVIIPVRNEESSISQLLDALLDQSLPPAEIIITDGGSTDTTASIIQSYINRGAPVRLIRTTRALPGRGRNLAAAHSFYEWLAFTDAGIQPGRDWLQSLAELATNEPSAEVIYGSYEPITDTLFKECAAIAYVSPPMEIDGAFVRARSIASVLMRRTAWETVGGFPEHLRSAEDLLFMNKLEEANLRIAYAQRAVVHWHLQPNFWGTFKRFAIYARNNLRAGLWREWQAAIFRRYALLGVIAVPALFVGMRWLVVPLAFWFLLQFSRAVRALHRNRDCYPAGYARNVLRLLLLAPIVATIDAAAFLGSINWLLLDKLRLGAGKGNDGSQG